MENIFSFQKGFWNDKVFDMFFHKENLMKIHLLFSRGKTIRLISHIRRNFPPPNDVALTTTDRRFVSFPPRFSPFRESSGEDFRL